MKQFIVLLAMIALGLIIFNFLVGDQDDSILNLIKRAWEKEIQYRQ